MDSIKIKVSLTVAILAAGMMLTAFAGTGTLTTADREKGMILDFGDRNTEWIAFDTVITDNPFDALDRICGIKGYEHHIMQEKVVSVNGFISSDSGRSWGFWGIVKGKTQWAPADTGVSVSDYAVTAWAYCSAGEKPTVAVDQSGISIYGYSQSSRVVTLSPSATEVLCSVGAKNTIIGTDRYSYYPSAVVEGQRSGRIAIVGDYTTPNYEAIVNIKPDIVFCDGCQYNHIQMAERLRTVNINAVLLYSGESMSTILDNIFIAGTAMGHDMKSSAVINSLEEAMSAMRDKISSSQYAMTVRTMLSLSGDTSPWVSGSRTYADDVLCHVYGENVFSSHKGWVHINSEQVMQKNPSVIMIITEDLEATQTEYGRLLSSLSVEWKATDAYRNGEIYLICESAADLAQRPGPRFAQLAEIMCRILNPAVFDDIHVGKIIGNDYKSYLKLTKDIDPEA